MMRSARSHARRRSARSGRRRGGAVFWGVIGLTIVVAGVALLMWVRTPRGGSAWLASGADQLYGQVQAQLEAAAARALPALGQAPRPNEGEPHTWPLPAVGGGAAVHCRVAAAPPGLTLAAAEQRLASAVERAGGRILWRERLPRDPQAAPSANGRPDDRREALRVDLGVSERPTHTLVLYAPSAGPPRVRWGPVPAGAAGSPAPAAAVPPDSTAAAPAGDGPLLAIVIDDWGAVRNDATRRLLALEAPLTLAILPGQRYSLTYAAEATPLAAGPLAAAAREATAQRAAALATASRRAGSGAGRGDEPALAGSAGRSAAKLAAAARRRAELSRRRLALGCPVEVSVLAGPGAPPAAAGPGAEAAGPIPTHRREVILHLPMEAEGADPAGLGPLAIRVGMEAGEVEERLAIALADVPGATGVSNHTGSRATADTLTMTRLLAAIKKRDLFFFDSLTTPRSAAGAVAREQGVPLLRNRLFLDEGRPGSEVVRARLEELVRFARKAGSAVGIGHPHPETAAVLAEELPRLQREGVRLVTLSELLALRDGPARQQP